MRGAKPVRIGAMLVLLLVPHLSAPGALDAAGIRHVLLVTLDTARADRLGCYGHREAVTPRLDGLAQKGVQFLKAYTPTPLTFPAHCSVMTGTLPVYHQARNNGFYYLEEGIPTLAEAFRSAGYRTAGFVASFVLDSRFGLGRGFERYDDDMKEGEALKNYRSERNAREVVDAFLPWLAKNARDPFFAWVHFYDPHLPYDPPPPFRDRLPGSPYDGEIAFVDSELGRILDALEEQRILDDTLIVVAGDHGEALGDHREIDHGLFLYEAAVRVPLLFVHGRALPRGKTVPAAVRLTDVMPTVLELAGLPKAKSVQGVSLMPWIGGRKSADLPVYLETYYPFETFGWSELKGITDGRWKLVQAPRPELYDLASDPRETVDLFEREASRARKMMRDLRDLIERSARPAPSPTRPLSTRDQERLRSLGYLGGGRPEAPETGPKADPKDRIDDYLLHHRGGLMEGEGNLAAALECYDELARRNTGVPSYAVSAAFVLMKMDRTAEAIALLEKARARFPSSALVFSRLMSFYLKAERWNEAIAAGKALLDLWPDDFDALFLSGSAYAMLGKWDEALELYEGALRVEPENKLLRQRHAFALAAVGRTEESLAAYRKLKDEFPGDHVFDLDIGQVYERTGQIVQARLTLEAAVRRHPGPDTYHAYALVLAKAGMFPEAVRWMRAYVSAAPETDGARRARALVLIAEWEKRKKPADQ
ncbi:MAG: sulfatase-like hydrolase/transferase [Candidatus Aminicenantes bacterium]|nr:sulfatase-like hydrolase/transferase [Candidatus Aminicenantes bacterium]